MEDHYYEIGMADQRRYSEVLPNLGLQFSRIYKKVLVEAAVKPESLRQAEVRGEFFALSRFC